MPLKDILVHFDGGPRQKQLLSLASAIAKRHQAHLVGLFAVEPRTLTRVSSLAVAGRADLEMLRLDSEQQAEDKFSSAALAKEAFRASCDRAGIAGEWRLFEGMVSNVIDTVTLHARYADLVVLGQADRSDPSSRRTAALVEDVLIDSGRPTLIVPYAGDFPTIGKNVLIAWNATREAARATSDSLPLIEDADTVTVLSFGPTPSIAELADLPPEDLVRHLARHSISATASQLPVDELSVGDMILSRASDLGVDLIVMGGYGHSRLREFVLGGATRTVLQHMTVPVLMSH
jgi:nucleotide-binding universal stress UspA family protein